MAPLPQNNTTRIFLDYITGNQATSQEHTLAIRAAGPVITADDVQARALALFQAIGPAIFATGWRVIRSRVQLVGSNFSTPYPLINGLTTFVGTGGNLGAVNEPREWSWQGRSGTSGRRVDFSIYGLIGATPDNFRYPAGGSSPAWVANSLGVLAANPANIWFTIDGTAPTWYSYVNVQFNSYWEQRIRTG